jgi:SNF2 family DNA or RNA helicase
MLAMEMGLGKTLCALYFIRAYPKPAPALYITEDQLMPEVLAEVDKCFPPQTLSVKWVQKDGSYVGTDPYHMLLCSYTQLLRWYKERHQPGTIGYCIFHWPWSRVFLDESQKISSLTTQTTQAVHELCPPTASRFCLSGTPQWSSQKEALWAQLKFCGLPVSKADYKKMDPSVFRDWFYIYHWSQVPVSEHIAVKEQTVMVPFYPHEKWLYDHVYQWVLSEDHKRRTGMPQSWSASKITSAYTMVRQLCVSPFLLCHTSFYEHLPLEIRTQCPWLQPYYPQRHRSSKLDALIQHLRQHQVMRAVLFVPYKAFLPLVTEALTQAQITSSVLNTHEDLVAYRASVVPPTVLLASYTWIKGINLPTVEHIYFLHQDDHLGTEKQALFRLLRWGRVDKQVRVWHFQTQNSVEAVVQRIAEQKNHHLLPDL